MRNGKEPLNNLALTKPQTGVTAHAAPTLPIMEVTPRSVAGPIQKIGGRKMILILLQSMIILIGIITLETSPISLLLILSALPKMTQIVTNQILSLGMADY